MVLSPEDKKEMEELYSTSGDCVCPFPLKQHKGKHIYPRDYGIYRFDTPWCKLFISKIPESEQHKRPELICGNCKYWKEKEVKEDVASS